MNTETSNLDISFPKDVFIQDDFNVDRFLQEYCSKSGLHKLHKELGIYIKYLQSMMIDIVNSESSAIVNLSSDLKVLQNKFSNISAPLGQFREEVSQIYKIIDLNLNNTKQLLEQKENIVSLKSSKINELRILISSQKISQILLSHLNDNQIDMEVLERSVDQYILQQMYCQNCNFKELKSQINNSTNVLNQILNNVFLKSLFEKNVDHIVRCLQMYMLMNIQNIAEELYRSKVVKPALQKIINEESLKSFQSDLSKLYTEIIVFITNEMKLLLSIIDKSQSISGFNFILNSVWLEVHDQLKLNMSSICAPGNPTVFHLRYLQTCTFLQHFEQLFSDNTQRSAFLQHPSFVSHKQQWNLPVYYEIRHLEIVQQLEEHFPDAVTKAVFAPDSGLRYKLEASCSVWRALQRCFSPDVYLPQLLDKFWKLNLQIVSRFVIWVRSLLKSNIPMKEEYTTQPTDAETKIKQQTDLKLQFLTCLYLDILELISRLSNPFGSGLPYLTVVPLNLHQLFIKSLADPKAQLSDVIAVVEATIVTSVYQECSGHVKQILQIPRLFRKTNRNVPTAPSMYLAAMLAPVEQFYQQYSGELEPRILERILKAIHTKIIIEYKTLVENVLTSVAKTEESLRRLKKIRSNTASTEASTITDDQKIRMQVQIDITHYTKEAKRFADSDHLRDLLSLVKDADNTESNK